VDVDLPPVDMPLVADGGLSSLEHPCKSAKVEHPATMTMKQLRAIWVMLMVAYLGFPWA
jgi:hypothetical protein